jgi:D-alanyl-D-alanine carboxypeptidase/D-alanyl-D-alanine-endopeptidase (penicillin-binding protein 4)
VRVHGSPGLSAGLREIAGVRGERPPQRPPPPPQPRPLTPPLRQAHESHEVQPGPLTALSDRLDRLIAPVAELAAVGICVRSLDRGDELVARNADAAFVPASNQKLLVAAAALDTLGPASCFNTRVLALGPLRGAVLHGDLVLRGGGDPTLTTEQLATLAEAVHAAGIRRVTGGVRGDDSHLDRRRLGIGWSWDDEAFAYAAPISGLTLNRNTVGVEVRPASRTGLPPLVRLDPHAAPVFVRVRAVTGLPGEPSTLRVERLRARDEIHITGRLARDSEPITTSSTVEAPPLYAAAVFTALLRERGVRVDGSPVVLTTPVGARLLHEVRSPPLSEIVREMNKRSDNLIAETLLKQLGVRGADRMPGAGIGGRGEAVLRAFLGRCEVSGPALALADASGLSRQNLVSPRNLVRLLAAMDRHPARAAFFDSLPIAGLDGTLRRRMVNTPAQGLVWAKTGTLTHVTALSGLATARNGERLAFSLLTNNYPGPLSTPNGPRAMEDAIAVALVEFER